MSDIFALDLHLLASALCLSSLSLLSDVKPLDGVYIAPANDPPAAKATGGFE